MNDVSDLLPGERFRAVPVTAFPFAHEPSNCKHHERFCELTRACQNAPAGVIGARWYLTLASADFAACEFHNANWLSIARASVSALQAAGPRATWDDLLRTCDEQQLPEAEQNWLFTLFSEPLDWIPGETGVTNGQHRLCALRAAGAEFVAADTSGHPPPRSRHENARAAALAVIGQAR
jgi:hypothetical protein